MSITIGGRVYKNQAYIQDVETGIDLSAEAGNVHGALLSPSGVETAKEPTIVIPTTGGILRFTFAADELNEVGHWLVYPLLVTQQIPGRTVCIPVIDEWDETQLPTATEIRDYLEGYCVTEARLTDIWIARRRDAVIKWIERAVGQTVTAETQYTEYLSGTGSSLLILSRRPVVSLDSIEYVIAPPDYEATMGLGSIELIAAEGVIKSRLDVEAGLRDTFVKGSYNIKVVYTAGTLVPDAEIREAIMALTAERMLSHLSSLTGGGNIGVAGYQRNYGEKGKYSQARKELAKWGLSNLAGRISGVTGS